MRTSWIRALMPTTGVLVKEERTHRRRGGDVRMEAETGGTKPQAGTAWSHQEGPSLELLEGVWPCLHLDFRLVASRTVQEHISVVLSHPVCGTLLWRPQETSAVGKGCHS